MTFRLRLIVAITLAVSVAVVVACFASFLAMKNAVEGSADSTLYSAAAEYGSDGNGESVPGVDFELVAPDGRLLTDSGGELPVDVTVLDVAEGVSGEILRTISIGSNDYRELLVPIPAGSFLSDPQGQYQVTTSVAQVFGISVTGQQNEVSQLALRLLLLALTGILIAAALGYLAAQTALRPLEIVTNEIETVAETSDVSYRLDEGSNDELGRLRRVFNRLLNSVESSQKLQRQLVLDSSHELRTPLTSLRTNAQVLSRASELSPDELRQISTDMISQTEELSALIRDLSELAQGDDVGGAVESIHFDELVDECVETARTHARTRSITVDAELESCLVTGSRDRLSRAVNNLLNNAIKFAPVDGHVLVRLHHGALVVADDGGGVTAEDLPFIFDRFWRSPGARSLPGSGLGLAIVNQVARDVGGSVSVGRSSELGGAEFTFRVPTVETNDD